MYTKLRTTSFLVYRKRYVIPGGAGNAHRATVSSLIVGAGLAAPRLRDRHVSLGDARGAPRGEEG